MELIAFVVAWGAAILGFSKAKSFVKDRLRYVEGIYRTSAPWKAGIVAALVATPVAWVLPVLSTASALLFGAAVGMGVAAGRRDLQRRLAA
jgi:hypothetical protein